MFLVDTIPRFLEFGPHWGRNCIPKGHGRWCGRSSDLVWNCLGVTPHFVLKIASAGVWRTDLLKKKCIILKTDDAYGGPRWSIFLTLIWNPLGLPTVSCDAERWGSARKLSCEVEIDFWRCSDRLKPQRDQSTRGDGFGHASPDDGCNYVIRSL